MKNETGKLNHILEDSYMKVYTTDKIRNVVILGHGSCGKTTLVEAMAYLGGLTSRLGKVEDGSTISDFSKEEQKREISIHTSLIPIEWNDYKLNILDTPGYFDFVGEVEEAISVADGAIIVVSAKAGIEAGTEKAEAYKAIVKKQVNDKVSFLKIKKAFYEEFFPEFIPVKHKGMVSDVEEW